MGGIVFDQPLTAGVVLIRDAIQSQDYASGSNGWRIGSSGSAEFNDAIIRGSVTIGGTIIGAMIATAETGNRIVLQDTIVGGRSRGEIDFYTEDTDFPGQIVVLGLADGSPLALQILPPSVVTYTDIPMVELTYNAGVPTSQINLTATDTYLSGQLHAAIASIIGLSGNTTQALLAESNSPNSHALTAIQNDTTGTSNAAGNFVSHNPNFTTLEVTGVEKNRGSIKVAHKNPGPTTTSDSSAAGLSIDLQYGTAGGTDAQGIFLTSTTGPTTGNLFILRNSDPTNREDLVVRPDGRVGIRTPIGHTPAGALEIDQVDNSTVGFAMTAHSSSAQQMLLLKDSGGAARVEVNAAGNPIIRATAFFTTSIQMGSASADLAGGSGVLGMRNAGAAPTGTPANGGVLYVNGGALKYVGSSGTVTTIAPA